MVPYTLPAEDLLRRRRLDAVLLGPRWLVETLPYPVPYLSVSSDHSSMTPGRTSLSISHGHHLARFSCFHSAAEP